MNIDGYKRSLKGMTGHIKDLEKGISKLTKDEDLKERNRLIGVLESVNKAKNACSAKIRTLKAARDNKRGNKRRIHRKKNKGAR